MAWKLCGEVNPFRPGPLLSRFFRLLSSFTLLFQSPKNLRRPCPLPAGMHSREPPEMEQELWTLWPLWLGSAAVTGMWELRPRKAEGVGES